MATLSTTAVGRTTLRRVPLSYKWIISDAKVFLESCKNLRSPAFSVLFPFSFSSVGTSSLWHLLLERRQTLFIKPAKEYFAISLCQGKLSGKSPNQRSRCELSTVLISDCVISLLHPETGETLHPETGETTAKKDANQCVIGDSLKIPCTRSISCSELMNSLFCDMLVIHVTATLLCIGDPVGTPDIVEKEPPDDIREKLGGLYREAAFTDATIQCIEKNGPAGSHCIDEELKVHRACSTEDVRN